MYYLGCLTASFQSLLKLSLLLFIRHSVYLIFRPPIYVDPDPPFIKFSKIHPASFIWHLRVSIRIQIFHEVYTCISGILYKWWWLMTPSMWLCDYWVFSRAKTNCWWRIKNGKWRHCSILVGRVGLRSEILN